MAMLADSSASARLLAAARGPVIPKPSPTIVRLEGVNEQIKPIGDPATLQSKHAPAASNLSNLAAGVTSN